MLCVLVWPHETTTNGNNIGVKWYQHHISFMLNQHEINVNFKLIHAYLPSGSPLVHMTQYASSYEVKSIPAWYKLDQVFTCENIRSSQRWKHTWIFIKQIKHPSQHWKSYMQGNMQASPHEYQSSKLNMQVWNEIQPDHAVTWWNQLTNAMHKCFNKPLGVHKPCVCE